MSNKKIRTRLKQCTKEELIHIILNYGLELHVIEAALIAIQAQRVKKWLDEERKANDNASAALVAYREIAAPYEGKPRKDVPQDIQIKAEHAWNKYVRLSMEARRISQKVTKLLLKQ